jgi:hypothetical protein
MRSSPNRLLRCAVARRGLALAAAALAGCSRGEAPPGPRGLLHVEAPVLVAMDAEPVAAAVAAPPAASRGTGVRIAGAAAAGLGALTATPGARLLGTPLAAIDASRPAADCPVHGDRAPARPATDSAAARRSRRRWCCARCAPSTAACGSRRCAG